MGTTESSFLFPEVVTMSKKKNKKKRSSQPEIAQLEDANSLVYESGSERTVLGKGIGIIDRYPPRIIVESPPAPIELDDNVHLTTRKKSASTFRRYSVIRSGKRTARTVLILFLVSIVVSGGGLALIVLTFFVR